MSLLLPSSRIDRPPPLPPPLLPSFPHLSAPFPYRSRSRPAPSQSKDPVSNVDFFDDLDSTTAGPVEQQKVSAILPRVFQDKKVRVFVRDAAKLAAAQEALNSFARSRQCASPMGNTPIKRPRADDRGPDLGC